MTLRSRAFKRSLKRRMDIMRYLTINPDADFREIAIAAGYRPTSLQSVTDHLDALEADGWIRRMLNRARAIEVLRPVHSVIDGKPLFFISLCHPHGQGIAGARLLSSSPGDVAIVGVDHVSHDAIDPVPHRDLSQHAVHQYADSRSVSFHALSNNSKGSDNHAE